MAYSNKWGNVWIKNKKSLGKRIFYLSHFSEAVYGFFEVISLN